MITISISDHTGDKETTFGFTKVSISSLQGVKKMMNTKAVSNGLFLNGHRNTKNLKGMGNVLFIDIDQEPKENEKPYYKEIEDILKNNDISFVSVPSKSANKYTYKRHIAIILSNYLPTEKEAYLRITNKILIDLTIDIEKLDKNVSHNLISFLAPCCITEEFTNYDEVSTVYNAKPFEIEAQKKEDKLIFKNVIDFDTKIDFASGETNTILNAIRLIEKGTSKYCYCPIHDDKKASATFYHNQNGTVYIKCGVCGTIVVKRIEQLKEPLISHHLYNYSIVVHSSQEKAIINILGNKYHKQENFLIWSFKVNDMNDIYNLMILKIQLVKDGFILNNEKQFISREYTSLVAFTYYISNTKIPNVYVNESVSSSKEYTMFRYSYTFIFNNNLFVESIIYATYQSYLVDEDFEKECNYGLSYFDYIINEMEKQKDFKHKDKRFKFRKNKKAIKESYEERNINKTSTIENKQSLKVKEILKEIKTNKYWKSNNNLNKSELGKKIKVSRPSLYKYLTDKKILEYLKSVKK